MGKIYPPLFRQARIFTARKKVSDCYQCNRIISVSTISPHLMVGSLRGSGIQLSLQIYTSFLPSRMPVGQLCTWHHHQAVGYARADPYIPNAVLEPPQQSDGNSAWLLSKIVILKLFQLLQINNK